MSVLVTGASGFIGGAVARHLAAQGRTVRRAGRAPLRPGIDVALPPADAADAAFDALMAGVDDVVHCAGLADARGRTEAELHAANARLAERLAAAAARGAGGRFVLVSSIRAVAGAGFSGTIDAATAPQPAGAYGRSKLAGERAATAAYAARPGDLTVLRLPAVYGPGMGGFLGRLLALSQTPLPLPLAGLAGRRPLVDVAAVAGAVACLLDAAVAPLPVHVASDQTALTPGEIVAAFRRGRGRSARLFALPGRLVGAAAAVTGRWALWQALQADQSCDARPLALLGWHPVADSRPRLAALAAAHARQLG